MAPSTVRRWPHSCRACTVRSRPGVAGARKLQQGQRRGSPEIRRCFARSPASRCPHRTATACRHCPSLWAGRTPLGRADTDAGSAGACWPHGVRSSAPTLSGRGVPLRPPRDDHACLPRMPPVAESLSRRTGLPLTRAHRHPGLRRSRRDGRLGSRRGLPQRGQARIGHGDAPRNPAGQDTVLGAYGLRFVPDGIFEPGAADVLVVPGGGWAARDEAGAWGEVRRGDLLPLLGEARQSTSLMAGVCTGTMLLAQGARGRLARSHHVAVRCCVHTCALPIREHALHPDGRRG